MSAGVLEKVSCGGSGYVSRLFLLLLGLGQRKAFLSRGQNKQVRQIRSSDKHGLGCSLQRQETNWTPGRPKHWDPVED